MGRCMHTKDSGLERIELRTDVEEEEEEKGLECMEEGEEACGNHAGEGLAGDGVHSWTRTPSA